MPIINSRINNKHSSVPVRSKENINFLTACEFSRVSKFNTTESFKLNDKIVAEWTIKNKRIWWNAKIIKIRNIAKGFYKPCRVYVVKYEPCRFYPKGKIMEHCFIDDCRLFDLTSNQLVTYYSE